MCSLEVDAAGSAYEYLFPEHSKFFSLLILLSLIQWSLLSMHNAYFVIPPSYITILLLQCDTSQGDPLGLGHLHMQDELCLQHYFIFYLDDDSECLTGHGARRSLSAVWAANATQMAISYLSPLHGKGQAGCACLLDHWLDHLLGWRAHHDHSWSPVSSTSPGVLYFPTVKWGTRKAKSGCHYSPIYFKGQLSARRQVVDGERLLRLCLKGKKKPNPNYI